LTTGTLALTATYEVEAILGTQCAVGTQGLQVGIQCSVAGATVACMFFGDQGALSSAAGSAAGASIQRLDTQGNMGPNFNQASAGAKGVARVSGIVITPGSGSPTIGIQAKGIQAGALAWILANSYLKVVRIA